MKSFMSSALLTLVTPFLRLNRSVSKSFNKNSSVLILPPGDEGSLGDEAMVVATIDHFRSQGITKIGILSFGSTPCGKSYYPELEVIPSGYLSLIPILIQYDIFCCLGADVMDGFYNEKNSIYRIKLVALAEQTGAKTSILGFSYNEKPSPAVTRALDALPVDVKLCARDPVSHKRLLRHLNRPSTLVADLAFLLKPSDYSDVASKMLHWLDQQKANDRIIVGVNANYRLLSGSKAKEPNELAKIYVDAITNLYAQNPKLSFFLIPHDFRNLEGEISDPAFAETIWSLLPSEIKANGNKLVSQCRASDIKAICRGLDVALSGRMHLAIACLGQGTPVACITYQGKFEGLFKHFELENMTIDPASISQGKDLCQFLMPVIEDREQIREQIRAKLPQITQLAKANFD